MENTILHLEGVVEYLIFENEDNGYTVFSVNTGSELVEAAGVVGEVHIGETVQLEGRFETHPTYGRQFKATACTTTMPQAVQDIRAYLASGALPYIGPATAKKLVAMFGVDTLDVIAEHPEQLTAVRGITEEKANAINQEFRRQFGAREVVTWLARYDISAARAMEVYRAFGPNTLNAITENPYLLCGEPLNLRFAQVDEMAANLQLPQESRLRVWAALLYVLRHNAGNGHTCLPRARLTATTSAFIGVEADTVEAELSAAVSDSEPLLGTAILMPSANATVQVRTSRAARTRDRNFFMTISP